MARRHRERTYGAPPASVPLLFDFDAAMVSFEERITPHGECCHTGLMEQQVTGFHCDEESHWVADLACGHTQHVRHNPPWQNRVWVTTEEGRRQHIGMLLNCHTCDDAMNSAPATDLHC